MNANNCRKTLTKKPRWPAGSCWLLNISMETGAKQPLRLSKRNPRHGIKPLKWARDFLKRFLWISLSLSLDLFLLYHPVALFNFHTKAAAAATWITFVVRNRPSEKSRFLYDFGYIYVVCVACSFSPYLEPVPYCSQAEANKNGRIIILKPQMHISLSKKLKFGYIFCPVCLASTVRYYWFRRWRCQRLNSIIELCADFHRFGTINPYAIVRAQCFWCGFDRNITAARIGNGKCSEWATGKVMSRNNNLNSLKTVAWRGIPLEMFIFLPRSSRRATSSSSGWMEMLLLTNVHFGLLAMDLLTISALNTSHSPWRPEGGRHSRKGRQMKDGWMGGKNRI